MTTKEAKRYLEIVLDNNSNTYSDDFVDAVNYDAVDRRAIIESIDEDIHGYIYWRPVFMARLIYHFPLRFPGMDLFRKLFIHIHQLPLKRKRKRNITLCLAALPIGMCLRWRIHMKF